MKTSSHRLQTRPRTDQKAQATWRAITLALLLPFCGQAAAVAKGDQAPPWRGLDLVTEREVSFPQLLEGRPAVVIFWATWCPYCKAFMPYAGRIQADYADLGVQIVTLNAKERGHGDPRAYARTLGFPLVAIADADDIAARYAVDFIPGLMVVDGSGNVVYRRRSTDLPAGTTVSELWDAEVRQALDTVTAR